MIKPLGDRVLLKPIDEENKTVSGLVIPDSAKEKPQTAEVVALGTGKKGKCDKSAFEFTVKVNDKVIYSKYSGTEVTVDGKDYLLVPESDILAVL
jgi:chaperonin GroES